ncbi:MAG: hypothetical protein A2486_16175 [Burkholderiales bacterium RIFOXYC12_FULL_65_23]|uniref:hypothetical protein n=1 Tax=Malikia spinosa TaxID=86180 RepID=UPI0008B3B354|nr:MAG: hypothetical protein A2486_16175 [Burkholderiales bacterium RIFOXYC12_FULL_65_23]
MAFSPAEFYTLAQGLHLQARQDGAPLRTLISRAYYGALIVARDAKGLSSKERGSHQRVIDAYVGQGDISDSLRTLRGLREKADYEPRTPLTASDGQRALACSKRVLHALGALPSHTLPTVPPAVV